MVISGWILALAAATKKDAAHTEEAGKANDTDILFCRTNVKTNCGSIDKPSLLFVWDFDWTIVNCNSDEYVPAQFLGTAETAKGFRQLWREQMKNNRDEKGDWHACVQAMVQRALESIENKGSAGTPSQYDLLLDAARRMPYLTPVREALEAVHVKRGMTGQIILSDGNTLFIGAFLDRHGLREYFSQGEGVVSNHGAWHQQEEDATGVQGRLIITHQSRQYGGHNCDRCPSNLCKTQALQHTVLNNSIGRPRPRIVYIGDGANDACPALHVLQRGDVLFARVGTKRDFANEREGPETDKEALSSMNTEEVVTATSKKKKGKRRSIFGLVPALQEAQEENPSLVPDCEVYEWRTGDELKRLVDQLLDDIP